VSISGKVLIEAYDTNINYRVPITREANYNWILPDGVTLIGLSDTNSVLLDWNDLSGQIVTEITDFCGYRSVEKDVDIIYQQPFPNPDQPHVIPGTVELINYDAGGEGIAYHDVDPENQGSGSRQDEGVDTEFNDGGENIGWIETGEWLEYSVNVEKQDSYNVKVRIASPNTTGGFRLLFNNDDKTGPVNVPQTGAWNSFSTLEIGDLLLAETDTLLRVQIVNGGFNMGRLIFASSSVSDGETARTEENIFIFPTVASQVLFIKDIHVEHNYSISDMSGCIVKNGVVHLNGEIAIDELYPGAYFLILDDSENLIVSSKFFKVD
jgi:hypothetical protein